MNSFEILKLWSSGNKTLFDIPVDEQLSYVESFREPKDNFERSFFQYRCQLLFISWTKIVVQEFLATIILPFVLFVLVVKGLFVKKSENISCISDCVNIKDIIPKSLISDFSIDFNHWGRGRCLEVKDFVILYKLFRCIDPYFVLKCFLKVSDYNYLIRKYSPKTLIVHKEFSFTSSILTEYCHIKGVLHYNVMHGEKLLDITDSFFSFDRCYVWTDHHATVLKKLRANPRQFYVEIPPSLIFDTTKNYDGNYYANYKYYLASFTKDEIEIIVGAMNSLKQNGAKIMYRPHPRYSDLSLLRQFVNDEEIELPNKVSISVSVSSTDCAIGVYTTVLTQAAFSLKKIVIDDLSNNKVYSKLKAYNYIFADTKTTKLSSLVNSLNHTNP